MGPLLKQILLLISKFILFRATIFPAFESKIFERFSIFNAWYELSTVKYVELILLRFLFDDVNSMKIQYLMQFRVN